MARKAEKEHTKDGLKLKIVNPNAAGIDIAYGEMQVCVPEDRDGENNRCFGSFTCDYEEIASWLKACGITTVAMESTGSYWVGLYFFLEEKGFDVLLANANWQEDGRGGCGVDNAHAQLRLAEAELPSRCRCPQHP